ncbi:MAG: AAA family ATPase, partial [Candidatus Thorarchaeota archaeon]
MNTPNSISTDNYLNFIKESATENVASYAKKLYDELIQSYPPLKLFQIDEIRISGLYPFKSDEIIRLESKLANLVYGGNGAGKSTCLDCIEFGLTGSRNIEIKKTFGKRIINRFVTETFLRVDNNTYCLKRWMTNPETHQVTIAKI